MALSRGIAQIYHYYYYYDNDDDDEDDNMMLMLMLMIMYIRALEVPRKSSFTDPKYNIGIKSTELLNKRQN